MEKKERNDAIRNLRRQGKNTAEIGRIFGITRQRVHKICTGVDKSAIDK